MNPFLLHCKRNCLCPHPVETLCFVFRTTDVKRNLANRGHSCIIFLKCLTAPLIIIKLIMAVGTYTKHRQTMSNSRTTNFTTDFIMFVLKVTGLLIGIICEVNTFQYEVSIYLIIFPSSTRTLLRVCSWCSGIWKTHLHYVCDSHTCKRCRWARGQLGKTWIQFWEDKNTFNSN